MHENTALHASALQQALSKFAMPAMSPTMTEGGIATWKKKEGESFAPGDVLVEIVRDPSLIYPNAHLTILTLYANMTGNRQGYNGCRGPRGGGSC